MIFAFDFFNTLDTHEDVRQVARSLFAKGHEVHIVSAISPGLPLDSVAAYSAMLGELKVPFTKVWRVDHVPQLKIDVLTTIRADGFWDDVKENVDLARKNRIMTCHVGVDTPVDWLWDGAEHAWTLER